MIFSYNRCPMLWAKRYLPTRRRFGLGFKPPTLLLFFLFISLSSTAAAKQLTLNLKAVNLETAFAEIKKQSGYGFWYEKKDLADLPKVTLQVKNADLPVVLEACFKGLPLSYQIFDKTIVVKRKVNAAPASVPAGRALQEKVRGKVVDAQTKEPLAGVLVKVKAPEMSVVTDDNGAFELALPAGNYELRIQYLGYAIKDTVLALPMEGEWVVALDASEQMLREVTLNAGYYNVKERERTGSISKITAGTIGKQPVNNALMALVGSVPGVQVTQSSGVPGGGLTVRVRGQNSIGSGNDPLYIVDGVIYPSSGISSTSLLSGINNIFGTGGANPMSLISPNDIQSIEVLKDADATAIYGSRGANGVVLVTTKGGAQGKPKADVLVSQGYGSVAHKVDLLNTEQYLAMRREAYFKNDQLDASSPGYNTLYDINGTWSENKYTDWQEELIGGSADLTNASVNLSGGYPKGNYLIAADYFREGTVVSEDFGFQRIGIRSNINFGEQTDRFHASFSLNFSHTKSNLYSNNLMGYIFLPPNAPDLLDLNGQLNWENNTVVSNPMADLLRTSKSNTDNVIGNLVLNYKILSDLDFKVSLGYNSIKRQEFRKMPLAAWPPSYGFTSTTRQSYFGNNYNHNFIVEPQFSYQKKVGKGEINGLLGSSFQANDSQINVIRAANFTSDDLLENMGSAATLTNQQNDLAQYRYVAVFGRLNYAYKNRYFLNLTARRDGSSRFGPGKQFANFGAIGAAWIFIDENNKNKFSSWINFGKLRSSYGLSGNDQISNYQYLQLWTSSTVYQGTSTFIPSFTAQNPDYGWETNRKFETALQLALFRSKLNIEVAYFRNRSSNQLLFQSLPRSVGQTGVYRNLPAIVQNVGWELDASYQLLHNKNLAWKAGFNISIPENKLVSYPNLEVSGDAIKYKVGEPLNILKTYNVSVNPETGDYILEDKNGNNWVDADDRYLVSFLGQRYFGGLSNSLRYGKFTLDLLFSFAKQNGRSYMSNMINPGSYSEGAASNQFATVLNRWKQVGDHTNLAKFSNSISSNTSYSNVQQFGNNSVVDASYIRLRNISVSYDFPKKWLSNLKISNASVSLQSQNTFTITNYIGFDPETQGINLPPLRTISMAFNLTF